MISAVDGYVHEVFRSIQGEGPYVGSLQIFVRFSGCSLRCVYCDTIKARERVPHCALRGREPERTIPNPVDAGELASCVRSLAVVTPGIHSMSVTGGEPLEQVDFLKAFLADIRECGLLVYLETNGLFEDAARSVSPLVDIVSLDVKLPSLCGGGDLFAVYRRILPVFRDREIFCKVVIAEGYDPAEFDEAVSLVAAFDKRIPFIIQPATPTASRGGVPGENLLACYFKAAVHLADVRVIPQCHRLLGLP
ncbi:MAG: 7-carboxy-7-deazaguanine synthase QueE [Candidatus Krumholzibacteria bacterium]|nr:7-carboxy-7-deazaguanine synthase QueE [Candidatus Krumholzibacteria bacterium]